MNEKLKELRDELYDIESKLLDMEQNGQAGVAAIALSIRKVAVNMPIDEKYENDEYDPMMEAESLF